ncbi:ATP-binding protein [Patescibacteria group bacterium]
MENIKQLLPIFASIREGIIITEPNGKIIIANPATESITGNIPDDLIGHKIQDTIIFKCDKSDISWFLPEALKGDRAIRLPDNSFLEQSKDKKVPVDAISTPLYTQKGEFNGIVLALRDLTEEFKARQKQYEFLGFITHQLRQPFGCMRWDLEILQKEKDKLSPKRQEILDDLFRIVLRFIDFTKDLVDVGRIERGKIEFKKEKIDLRKIIIKTTEELKGLSVSQNVEISLSPKCKETSPLYVMGDSERLRDALSNLITNAIRYNKPKGTVTIDVEKTDIQKIKKISEKTIGAIEIVTYLQQVNLEKNKQFILLTISDTGLGIPKDQQKQVFNNFFRGENVIKKGLKGTGLGLSIVKVIIEQTNGRIFFKSKENIGTAFYIVFPIL